MTRQQLLDAVAVGQVTPGPVFTTATFIGYVLAAKTGSTSIGIYGAIAATVGIFAPAFVFVAITGPLVRTLRRSDVAGAMLDGLSVASVALMAFVTVELARATVLTENNSVDPVALTIALISGLLLFRFRINSTWLIAGGAAVGAAILLARPHQ